MTAADAATEKLAADAAAAAADMLKDGRALEPFLIIELDGLRDVEHFERNDLQEARTRASRLSRPSAGNQLCALAYEGRVKMDQEAILVEVLRPGEKEVEVFCQPFRPKGGRFRPFRLIGEVGLAGRRELLA